MNDDNYEKTKLFDCPCKAGDEKILRQIGALVPGLMIILAAGFHFGWGIFPITGNGQNHHLNTFYHMIAAHLIGLSLGSTLSAFLLQRVKMKVFCYGACSLMFISSIFYVTFDTGFTSIIIVGRYLSGIAHGFIFLPLIDYASQISVTEKRGFLLSLISLATTTGLLLSAISTSFDLYINSTWSTQALGIVGIIWSIASAVLVKFLVFESPLFLIMRGDIVETKRIMMKLRMEILESYALQKDLEDMNLMVTEDMQKSSFIFSDGNFISLLNCCLLRLIYSLSICVLLNFCFAPKSSISQSMGVIVFAPKVFSEIISCFFIDFVGRRKLLFFSIIFSSFFLILLGGILYLGHEISRIYTMGILYQLPAGGGLGAVSVTYIGESFSMPKKRFSMLFVILVEVVTHLLSMYFYIYQNSYSISNYTKEILIGIGSAIFISGFYFYKMLPETNNLRLRQCTVKHKN